MESEMMELNAEGWKQRESSLLMCVSLIIDRNGTD